MKSSKQYPKAYYKRYIKNDLILLLLRFLCLTHTHTHTHARARTHTQTSKNYIIVVCIVLEVQISSIRFPKDSSSCCEWFIVTAYFSGFREVKHLLIIFSLYRFEFHTKTLIFKVFDLCLKSQILC